jgi:hypothetical protein
MMANDRDSSWYQFSAEIVELLESGDFDWAQDTLEGIRASVEDDKTVTPGQRQAIENIRAARQRQDGRRSRRYEGFRR